MKVNATRLAVRLGLLITVFTVLFLQNAIATIYSSSPALRTWTSSGNLVYRLQVDNSAGSGTTITNGLVRFRVSSDSGDPFQSSGTVQIREGSLSGTVVQTISYDPGITTTPWSATISLPFTSGNRTYYATRLGSATTQIASGGVTVTAWVPLPAPTNISVNTAQTTAIASWSWSGISSQTTGIRLGVVKTNGYDGNTIETMLSEHPIDKALKEQQLDQLTYFVPGATYRVNIRYVAATGYEDASAAKAFTMANLSAPTLQPPSLSSSSVYFDWSNVTAANGYRLMVRKVGASWPASETAAATASVPVNIDMPGHLNSQFTWSEIIGTQVAALPIANQAYEWRVKSYYDGTVSSGYTTGSSFTMPVNARPTIDAGYSASSANGEVTVGFTARDTDDTFLRYDLQIYNSDGTNQIPGTTGIQQGFGAINGLAQSRTFTPSLINGALTNGVSYNVRITVFDPSFENNGTNYRTVYASFTYHATPPNALGIDLTHLNGKKVRGPLVFGATNASATTPFPWNSFNLRSGSGSGPIIAQTYVGGGTDSVLSEVAWRKPDGTYIGQWSDIISSSTLLVLEGVDSVGQTVQSAPFTVTPQTTLNVSIPAPSGAAFPTVVPSNTTNFNPTFSAFVSGNSGSASYAWFYRSTSAAASSSTFSPTFTGSGLHMVTVRVSDTNNNVTWAQYLAPVAKRMDYGNPSVSRSGSALAGPVDVVSGNLHLLTEDLAVDCYGIPFALTRSYNSRPGAASGQWLFSIEEYALTEYTRTNQSDLNGRGLKIMRSDGSPQDYFLDSSGNYRPINPGNFDLAEETGIGASRQLRIYEMGGVVRTYVKSPIPVSSSSYSATLWTLKSVKSPRGHGITINHSSTPSHLGYLPRITTVTDAANRTYTISYDSSGRIDRVSDFSGRQVAYTWDSNNNITSFQDVRGYTTNYSYRTSTPGNKRLLAIQAPRGNFFLQALSYDSSDRVLSFQDGDGYTTSYSYATSSTTVTPSIAQERTRYTIDSSTKAITGVIESYGYGNYTTSLSVRSSATADSIANYSLVDGKTDPSNRSTTLGYAPNTRGQVQTITGNDGKTASVSYNNLDLSRNLYTPSTITSRAGRSYDMEANAYGEVTRSEDAAGNATTTSYNSYGVPATITDARLNSTTIFYNTSGYPTQITDAVNNSIFITNDALGRPTRVVDRRGSKTDFTYDAAGNVLTISDNLNNQIINEYDANGNLTRTRDRRGNLTVSSYNNRDLPYQIFRNAPVNGATMTITETNFYDSMGRVIQTTNGRGNSTTQSFTNRGQLATVTNGVGEVVLSLTYNPDGTVATRTTGSGASASTITFGYDSLGRQTSATDSLGNQVRTDYNDDHQVTGTRDARGAWTTMSYDAAARLASVTDANGAVSRVYYDSVGNVTQVQDPRGYSTYHTYDPLNRRTQERDELNRLWGYAYDQEGNLLTETFPDGRVFNSTYDSLGRLDYISYGGPRFADFDYDADGNMTTMIDHLGISGFTWDSMNRLQSAHDPFGQTISYLYDAASNRTRITYPGSRIVDYTFDSAERMSTVTPWAGGAFTYSWRPDGKLSQLVNGNGTYTTYGYDAAARLTNMLTRNGGGTTLIAQNFTLDPNGNITRITGEQPTAPPQGVSKAMTVDITNRLLTDDGYAVSHDAAGRMTANPSVSGGTATFFARDWLASYTPNGGNTATYAYNGFGQRLSRSQGAATIRYLLDHNQSLPAVLAENDASNSPQRFYIHGLGLLASIDTSNNVETYHANHRGDILALTNASGMVTESYGYSPYGLTSASNSFSTNPFRFGGALGVMDEGNGVHFMRARFYNASLGRFLSMDQLPGGLANPQSLDRFAYALGNPLSNVDPSGLAPTIIEAAEIAKNVYSPSNEGLSGGWALFGGANYNPITGYRTQMYRRNLAPEDKEPIYEYVYAFAGSDEPEDWKNNIAQHFYLPSNQYRTVVAEARLLNKLYAGKELTFVGHSLGGGLANLAAKTSNRTAVAFNPAIVRKQTILRYLTKSEKNNNPLIENHISNWDFIYTHARTNNISTKTKNYIYQTMEGRAYPYEDLEKQFRAHSIDHMLLWLKGETIEQVRKK